MLPEWLRTLVAQFAAGAGLAVPDGIEECLHLVEQQVVTAEQTQFKIPAAFALGTQPSASPIGAAQIRQGAVDDNYLGVHARAQAQLE
jgi:hypothetical protein